MADIRIKDLTTTASTTAADDFFAADGATNGTRKLSAYSPTFGGNATVGGTLTVSGVVQSGGFYVPGNGSAKPATNDSYFASTATTQIPLHISAFTGGGQSADIVKASNGSGSDWFAVKGNGQVACYSTTASTTTSSGALVVCGGVGVGGAIYAGGDIITTKSNGVIKASGSSANAEVAAERLTLTPSSVSMVAAVSQPQLAFTSDTAGSYTWGRILANSSEIVRVHSANLTAIANVAGAGIAVAGGIINTGSLTTGAPSGGTSAAWKLGAVATVSPTSPNRTIEVDIGGTIYYIHAKTTNN
jgi:hypothetical protein